MTPYHNCLMDHHHFAGSTSSLSVSWLVSHAGWVFFGSLTVLASQMLEHSNLTNNSKRLQAYYGPGVLPPTYFAPPMAPGHPHPPYMWGPQVFVFFYLSTQWCFVHYIESKSPVCISAAYDATPFWNAICRYVPTWWSLPASAYAHGKH
jgi:hypothetical protein